MRISPTWECLKYIVTVVWYDSKEDTFDKVIEKRLYFGKGYMNLRVPFGTKDICNRTQKKTEKTGSYDEEKFLDIAHDFYLITRKVIYSCSKLY